MTPPPLHSVIHLVIGMPSILPAEGPHTRAAKEWAEADAFDTLRLILALKMPGFQVSVGRADGEKPRVSVFGAGTGPEAERIMHRTVRTVEEVRATVAAKINAMKKLPEGASVLRELHEIVLPGECGINEHFLKLMDPTEDQALSLRQRAWEIRPDFAHISLTIDVAEREREWLLEANILAEYQEPPPPCRTDRQTPQTQTSAPASSLRRTNPVG